MFSGVRVVSMIDGMWLNGLAQAGSLRDVAAELDHQYRRLWNVKHSSVEVDDDPVGTDRHQLTGLLDLGPVHAAGQW